MAWLYRISTNVCLNLLRHRRLRGREWIDRARESFDRATTDAEVAAAERQWASYLLGAADDELTRALVLHIYVDEMSQAEAAELLGLSRATASARLARFRERALKLMGATE
jgi:RNA polymerase sigma-70 factor (ECF subfamily)